jgi:hypothetical protein
MYYETLISKYPRFADMLILLIFILIRTECAICLETMKPSGLS